MLVYWLIVTGQTGVQNCLEVPGRNLPTFFKVILRKLMVIPPDLKKSKGTRMLVCWVHLLSIGHFCPCDATYNHNQQHSQVLCFQDLMQSLSSLIYPSGLSACMQHCNLRKSYQTASIWSNEENRIGVSNQGCIVSMFQSMFCIQGLLCDFAWLPTLTSMWHHVL